MKRNNKIVSYSLCSWLLLLVFCMQFVVSLCAKNLWAVLSTRSLSRYDYILLTQIFAVALPCLLMCLYNRSGFRKTFSIKALNFYKLWNCIGLGICLQPAAILLNIPLQKFMDGGGAIVAAPSSMNDVVTMILFICLVPAVCEEFLLRGMVLTSVKRKGYAFSIIVTTLMFVLLHGDASSALGHAVLGAAATFAVLNTNSVFAGVLVHFSFNFSGIMIDYITNKFYVQGGYVGSFEFFVLLGIAGIVLSCLFFRGVHSKKVKKYHSDDLLYNLWKAFFNIPVIIFLAMYILRIVL